MRTKVGDLVKVHNRNLINRPDQCIGIVTELAGPVFADDEMVIKVYVNDDSGTETLHVMESSIERLSK